MLFVYERGSLLGVRSTYCAGCWTPASVRREDRRSDEPAFHGHDVAAEEHGTRRGLCCSYGEHPIHALSRMVHLHERAHMPAWGCELQVHLKDGRVLTGSVPDQRCFAYDWDGTVSIMKGVSDEWQVPDSPARFARLRNAVDQFEESGSATDLVDCCISSTEA